MTSPKQMPPKQFAEMLTHKLEILAREQKTQEKLDKCLQQQNDIGSDASLEVLGGAQKTLGDTLKEKLSVEEDSDQAILDEHVSRVWSDQTPSRSPRLSPDIRRPMHNYLRPYKQRKEKDVDSTFSVDSGNIHDFPEGSDLVGAGSMSSLGSHLPKSKSVPSDYADSLHKQDLYLQSKRVTHYISKRVELYNLSLIQNVFVRRSRAKIPKVRRNETICHEEIDDGIDGQWSECRQRRAAFYKQRHSFAAAI